MRYGEQEEEMGERSGDKKRMRSSVLDQWKSRCNMERVLIDLKVFPTQPTMNVDLGAKGTSRRGKGKSRL